VGQEEGPVQSHMAKGNRLLVMVVVITEVPVGGEGGVCVCVVLGGGGGGNGLQMSDINVQTVWQQV
jgi:hypothetical protein